MAAMVVASAMPAFAAASENASCVGESFSNAPPESKGQFVSELAEQGGIGPAVSGSAHNPRETVCAIESDV